MVTKDKKQKLMEQYLTVLEKYSAMYFVETNGVKAWDIATFKKELKKSNASFFTVKNTIFKIAATEKLGEGAIDDIKGQHGLIVAYDDAIEIAKKLKEFRKKVKDLNPVFGFIDKDRIENSQIEQLAEIPPREVLLGQLAGVLAGNIRSFMCVLQGNTRNLVNVIDARKNSINK